jgi:hypothetical protein
MDQSENKIEELCEMLKRMEKNEEKTLGIGKN